MPSRKRPPLPPEILAVAVELARDESKYHEAENALQAAIDSQDEQGEKHWRMVFEGYCRVAYKHAPDPGVYHLVMSAGGYASGHMNPRADFEYSHEEIEEAMRDPANQPPPPRALSDDDVPF